MEVVGCWKCEDDIGWILNGDFIDLMITKLLWFDYRYLIVSRIKWWFAGDEDH
jgi:hypothetical protein